MARARLWWLDTPRLIRKIVWVCIPLGVIAVSLGVYGDGHGWWDDRSFLTNLASSFASLLFGVPLALVVLTHLSAMQAEVAERRTAQRRISDAEKQFVAAFQGRLPTANVHETAEKFFSLATHARTVRRAIHNPTARAEPVSAVAADFLQEYRAAFVDPQAWGSHVGRRWNVLDQEARPLAEAAGLPWIRAGEVHDVTKSVEGLVDAPDPGRLLVLASRIDEGLQSGDPNVARSSRRHRGTLEADLDSAAAWCMAVSNVARFISVRFPGS
ncbi:hypothetical protein [Streptomyces hydrogenans]|uniref:hypothetical protein n=1 Tax=Streptomyces hydrogenans TaxID=1873719 RepID=UPI0037FE4016